MGMRDPWAYQVVLVLKNPLANTGDVRDTDSIPESGRSPGGGCGNPLQYSCLENSMDRGAWLATVHEVTKNQTQLKWLSTHAQRPSLIHVPSVLWYYQTLAFPGEVSWWSYYPSLGHTQTLTGTKSSRVHEVLIGKRSWTGILAQRGQQIRSWEPESGHQGGSGEQVHGSTEDPNPGIWVIFPSDFTFRAQIQR